MPGTGLHHTTSADRDERTRPPAAAARRTGAGALAHQRRDLGAAPRRSDRSFAIAERASTTASTMRARERERGVVHTSLRDQISKRPYPPR